MRRAALVVLGMLASASPAFAHAFLTRAEPPVGSEVTAPARLSIDFSEGVEPLFSAVAVQGPGGAVATGKLHTASGNNKRLVVDLPKLAPGGYTVTWHVTSVDTHKTEGTYTFTVKP